MLSTPIKRISGAIVRDSEVQQELGPVDLGSDDGNILLAPRWLPEVEGVDVVAENFPYTRTVKFIESRRTPSSSSRWSNEQGVV